RDPPRSSLGARPLSVCVRPAFRSGADAGRPYAVAGAAHGLDEIAPLPELLPEPLHVGIHRARMLIAAQLPDVSQQDLPRLQPSRPRHESREQLELEGGELDLVSVDVGAMRDLVDAHRTDAVAQLLGPGRRAPAQDGTD